MQPVERAYWRTLDSDRDRLAFERLTLVEKAAAVKAAMADAKKAAEITAEISKLKARG